MINQIVTGERIQQLCHVYFGFKEDFDYNPIIKQQTNKHFNLLFLFTLLSEVHVIR